MKKTSVTVLRPGTPTVDRFGNEVPGEPIAEVIDGAIIEPGANESLEASRPEGVIVSYTVHLPMSGVSDIGGASIMLPEPFGGTYRVVGNPVRYMEENMPPMFRGYVPVEVERTYG